MAEHVEHAPSNTGRAARSASSRRRSPTPPADTDATQAADAQPGALGGEPMLDLFGKEPEPALELEAAGAAQDSQATPARPEARTNATEPTADAVSTGGNLDESSDPTDSNARAAADGLPGEAQESPQESPIAAGIEAPEPHGPPGTQASELAATASDLPAPQEQGEAIATMVALAATQAEAPPQSEATAAPKQPEPLPDAPSGALASGHSYAPTSATGNAARMISAVHAADVGAVVHGQAPERATAALPAEIVATMTAQMAAQTRRTKWLLTAAVAALVVTAGVAIAQTLVLASLSADATAQQQRLDVLMQNQQAALDNMASRVAALTVAAPVAAAMAPATAATSTAREPENPTPPRRPARAAKTPKSTEKPATHTTGSKSSKAHSQPSTRQAATKS
ncbi:hypothetical protein LMG28688_04300 [Paraburkholderia caffeinitolerans]|uniref:Uncharacterized protein n=1 Tax=Paraburkholderia caffeinitolerans TaxID=1723730 RepID=A0A6J5GD42_9BURK|nr:hypothetical protein [Paraburkholderia caffeinitolerans]CAB3796452.1 hypothetical protein LMG28688_04300 [Paraburkholderia caffeinitolerans]